MAESTGFTRRHFLTVATVVTGGAGVIAYRRALRVVVQAERARSGARRARSSSTSASWSVGALAKVEWRGRPDLHPAPHRTKCCLAQARTTALLRDPTSKESSQPSYATNEHRSLRPAFLVLEGVCTHLGCAPMPRFEVAPADLGPSWPGGFFCPCHGSRFDLAGRVFQGVPAPTNLTVPPYRFVNDNTILIGSDTGNS